MLLTFIIILMLIGSAVIGSLYSNFLVFYTNFSETENYNKAYYTSISAIERAELVLRQHQPGYEGSGGWKGSESGSFSDRKPDTNFSYLSNDSNKKSTLFWNIKSRTNRIPAAGNGDVDRMLSAPDSSGYNKMDYENSEIVLLYYDDSNSTSNPYHSTSEIKNSNIEKITTKIRLPGYINGTFGFLNTYQSLTPGGKLNDPIVDRQLKGNYIDSLSLVNPFIIYTKQDGTNTSIIRESDINDENNIEFSNDRWNPNLSLPNSIDTINIISNKDNDIKGFLEKLGSFIHGGEEFSGVQLKFSLLNLLQSTTSGMIYPFLEYNIEFTPSSVIVPDKYYKIETVGNFGDYQINTIMFKPTITESILRTFTTIL